MALKSEVFGGLLSQYLSKTDSLWLSAEQKTEIINTLLENTASSLFSSYLQPVSVGFLGSNCVDLKLSYAVEILQNLYLQWIFWGSFCTSFTLCNGNHINDVAITFSKKWENFNKKALGEVVLPSTLSMAYL